MSAWKADIGKVSSTICDWWGARETDARGAQLFGGLACGPRIAEVGLDDRDTGPGSGVGDGDRRDDPTTHRVNGGVRERERGVAQPESKRELRLDRIGLIPAIADVQALGVVDRSVDARILRGVPTGLGFPTAGKVSGRWPEGST